MALQATNDCVFVKRDETQTESKGLLLPSGSAVKPNTGTVLSIGQLVRDSKIKASKGKKVLFHKGVGYEIEYESETFLVLQGHEIIAIV